MIDYTLAERTVARLKEMGLTLSCAESLTGGLIGSAVVSVAGASAVFHGSAVTYTEMAKSAVLGVRDATLTSFSAVSSETAREMADGSRRLYSSDIAVSATGNAGPTGNPVGLVYIGLSYGDRTQAFKFNFEGDRTGIRESAVNAALACVLSALTEK